MPRYIDADKLYEEMLNAMAINALEVIKRQPAEDVAPVVHAHWVKLTSDGHVLGCSNCKYEIYNEIYYPDDLQKYCSECGAKMDEEEKENEQHNKS